MSSVGSQIGVKWINRMLVEARKHLNSGEIIECVANLEFAETIALKCEQSDLLSYKLAMDAKYKGCILANLGNEEEGRRLLEQALFMVDKVSKISENFPFKFILCVNFDVLTVEFL